jgi:hypothetical protein
MANAHEDRVGLYIPSMLLDMQLRVKWSVPYFKLTNPEPVMNAV